jgi:hypothetical protein
LLQLGYLRRCCRRRGDFCGVWERCLHRAHDANALATLVHADSNCHTLRYSFEDMNQSPVVTSLERN